MSLEGGMLAKVDRTSMMTSLECRAPFLTRELWEFANTLPESYLMKGWNKKHILKEAFSFLKAFWKKAKVDLVHQQEIGYDKVFEKNLKAILSQICLNLKGFLMWK